MYYPDPNVRIERYIDNIGRRIEKAIIPNIFICTQNNEYFVFLQERLTSID
jgi:hypothetical protein